MAGKDKVEFLIMIVLSSLIQIVVGLHKSDLMIILAANLLNTRKEM
jgi:hypothetical protein